MKTANSGNALGEKSIPSLLVQYSVPCVLSLLVGALYNIVDQIFIGNSELSTLGNAATGVVFPFFIIAQAFAWCFGNSCATYLNICQGKNDTSRAHKVIGTGLIATLLVCAVLMALFLPLQRPLLTFFGASENILDMAVEYLTIIVAFFPMFMLSNMMENLLRADGSPAAAMLALLVGAVVNLILDPLFIFAFHWGMTGAALATVLGQTVSFLFCLIYVLHPKTFRLTRESFRPDWKGFGQALRYGISTIITQMTILVVTVFSNMALSKYGAMSTFGADIPLAVFGIASKVLTVVINIIVGIVLGCQPIVSYNMGSGQHDRVLKLYRMILLCALVIGLCATALFEFAPDLIIGMFGNPSNIDNPADYWTFAHMTFRIYLALVTFTCITKINAIFFQSAGKPVYSIIAALVRDILCFVPLLLILPHFFGIAGILYAGPAADFLAMLVSLCLMTSFVRQLKAPAAPAQDRDL